MAEPTVREKLYKEMLLNIAHDLGLYDPDFTEIVNKIFALQHPWVDVDGTKNMPLGEWIVRMADGKYGTCQIVQGSNCTIGIINGHFYFDLEPVIAYMPVPEYMPKGG